LLAIFRDDVPPVPVKHPAHYFEIGGYPRESCGLIIAVGRKQIYVPCLNTALEASDYYDSRSVTLPVEINTLEAWNVMTAEPGWLMRLAFRMRDAMSSLFGVKRIGGFSGVRRETVQVGEKLDFFLVEHSAPPFHQGRKISEANADRDVADIETT
jgi:hypothetical protein